MVLTTRIRFIVTISQVVAVLGATYTDMNGLKKRTPRPFVCNALRALDSSPVVDKIDPINSGQSITSVTNNDNPVSMSTEEREKDDLSTTFITKQTTNNVSTQLSGLSEIASTTPPTIKETSDPTTVLTTGASITTRGVTSSNDTAISKAGTTTNEVTGIVSSDPSTVGSTAIGTTVIPSTEKSTQGTTGTTGAPITTRGVTSSNATALSKAGTTTNEVTGIVSSDPSTVGSTTIGTTFIPSTEKSTTTGTTGAPITTRGVTSNNATALSKAGTTTNEVTGIVSSDPSTVGSTTIGTTVMSTTEASTQGTTNTSVTVVTTEPVTTPTAAQTTKATCPVGYSAIFNISCYKISNDSDPTLSRSDARKLCESESAHLVFIESKEEDDFLISKTSHDTQYWIGANGLPNDFYWDDGSNIEFKPIAEQNIAFDDLRGCYRMKIAGNESSWPDAPCFRKYNYICEYDLERRTKQCPDDISICTQIDWIALDWNWEHTAPELTNSVPAYMDGAAFIDSMRNYASRGIHHLVYRSNDSSNNWCSFRLVTDCMTWDEVSILNTAYTLVANWLRWHEASEACIFYDSNLVTVENEDENSWLQSFISSKGIDVWIGLSREDETDGWKWQNRNSTNQFFNWGESQPNTGYSCTVLDHATSEWKTKSCDSSTPFVCERRL